MPQGPPAQLYYELDVTRLSSLWEDAKQGVLPSSSPESGKLVAGKRQTRSPESGKHSQKTTTKTSTEYSDSQSALLSKSSADRVDYQTNVGGLLARVERLLPTYQGKRLTPAQRQTIERWHEDCERLMEEYDSHTGDPIGGRAYRLCHELRGIIDDNGGYHP
jgi:hypothetical protein